MLRLYFDVNAIIHAVEGRDAPTEEFFDLLISVAHADVLVFTSELSLAELLVRPLREQDFRLIVAYNNLLAGSLTSQLKTVPVSREILGRAARIRNLKDGIKLPDAVHIATAEFEHCDMIVTGDKRWTGATKIRLTDPIEEGIIDFLKIFR